MFFIFLQLIQGGSQSSQIIVSWGIKLLITFKMVPLKIETCLSGLTLSNALFQSKLSFARMMSSILACL